MFPSHKWQIYRLQQEALSLSFLRLWKLGKASICIQGCLTADGEQTQCISMSVYTVHYNKWVSLLTLLISGMKSDHVHRFVCQVHIWGEPMTFRLRHNAWKVQESRCTWDEEKNFLLVSVSASLSRVHSLPVFTDLSMSFGSVSDILSSVSYRQLGSGFVRIKVECWDKSCPSALQCRSGQPQVTSSAV